MAKNKFSKGKKPGQHLARPAATNPPPAPPAPVVEDIDEEEESPEPSLEEMALNLRAILEETEVKARRLRDSMELPSVAIEELEDKLADEQKERGQLEATVASQKERLEELEKLHAAARGQVEELESQLGLLEQEKRHLGSELDERQRDTGDLEARLDEALKSRQHLADQLAEAERSRQNLEERLSGADGLSTRLDEAERARVEIEERLRSADETHAAALRKFEEKLAEHDLLRTRCQEAEARRDELDARLKELEGGASGLQAKQREAENRLGELEDKLQGAQADLLEGESRLEEAQRKARLLEEQLEEARRAKAEVERHMEEAQQLRDDLLSQLEQAQLTAAEHQGRTHELEGKQQELAKASTQVIELREMLDMLEANLLEAEDKLACAPTRSQLEDALARAQEAEERVGELTTAADEVEQKLRQSEFRLGQIKQIFEETDEAARAAEERADAAERRAREAERKLRQLEVATGRVADAAGEAAAGAPEGSDGVELSSLRKKLESAERESLESVERAELAEQKLIELEDEVREANERAMELEEKFGEVEANSIRLREELEQACQQLEETRSQADPSQFEELRQKLQDTEARAKAAEQKSRESVDRLFQSEQRMVAASARTRTAEERIVTLERELDNLKRKFHEAEERMKSGEAAELDPETERMAFEDRLTSLPNFNILQQYIDYTFKQVHRYKRGAALLCIDLDRFKVINDTLGFRAGDEVLRQVADRLKALVRESDVLGRRGDDEFLILLSELERGDLPEVRTPEDWARACNQMSTLVSNRILSALAPPYSVQNQKLHVTASIGASVSLDAETAEEFIEHAETAMVAAKEAGRNNLQFYTADLKQRRQRKLSFDGQLRQALENDEFTLLYQPIVHLSSGRLAGAEALLRWRHPEMNRLLAPEEFLSIAEETGLIVPIGTWALMQACRQAALWRDEGLDLFTAVNMSTRQLMQADLPKTFLKAFEVTNIDPKMLVVDILEGSSLVDPERIDQNLEELTRLGVAISIDDFGVGFSSLKRLGKVKMLKFHQSLVQDVGSRHGSSICVAMLGICSTLAVRSVAEGVETAEQATFFLDKGCELAQGFYFSDPVLPDEITEMWLDNRTWSGF